MEISGTPVNEAMPSEAAKEILDTTNNILNELSHLLCMIDDAIFGPKIKCDEPTNQNISDECFLSTLNRQREKAKEMLVVADHIRGGLW